MESQTQGHYSVVLYTNQTENRREAEDGGEDKFSNKLHRVSKFSLKRLTTGPKTYFPENHSTLVQWDLFHSRFV